VKQTQIDIHTVCPKILKSCPMEILAVTFQNNINYEWQCSVL